MKAILCKRVNFYARKVGKATDRPHNHIIESGKCIVNEMESSVIGEKSSLTSSLIYKITRIIPKKVSVISLTDKHFV
ncbi:hypothetical protein XIS1_1270040 [Xenorhabdus innexi]|uniref:Uncharacterized protein n=1 Tax=Xenorhabdus innexi TaxID=290109 RepID=A0A1N6MSK5_9GAMM|nr:hypothetical protein XIS1_1270040 [Xenorhabdus innexi]